MKENVAVICVDDEMIVLTGLKSQLNNKFNRRILIETVESGQEALELYHELIADGYSIPVIISDQIMPGLKGDELLIKFYEIDPEMKFILLTGQASPDAVGNALNKANLYRYIAKPWDVEDLNMTVAEAINSYFQVKEIRKKEEERRQLLEELKVANESLEQKVEERTIELQLEKNKTEDLLLNILPREIANELKSTGASVPKHYQQTTILFTDFKGFTSIAAQVTPTDLVAMLNECFTAFDAITEKYHLEKIKTIGDAYMCAGGIPSVNTTNALDAVGAGVEILRWVDSWNAGRMSQDLPELPIRVGIHTGELVAGVIGSKKFAYDVWGDAVNIASRLESNGIPGKINISEATFSLIKEHFTCEYRGEIEVKNIGALRMYLVLDKIQTASD
ncbi:MAG: response regulator [Bacteroidetes bacterium]|nr:response regulator [Bacteroidota bacterium]